MNTDEREDHDEQTKPQSDSSSDLVWRVRLLAAVMAFAAIAFRQSSGLVVADTKLDLTADPARFMSRALNLWDPQAAFGQLQNQAYGYLFPVGPFHLFFSALGMPPWVVQRLWWSIIFAVALMGMWLLSRAFGVRSRWARLITAVVFAASPRFIAETAITSVEVWPLAVAPWVLLPLVATGRPTRWRVSRSAMAFLLVGAVNAVATLATLVLPALWLFTRRWDRRHVRFSAAWVVAIAAVSAWWVVPLLVLGRFSPPFLSWIENAPITTSTASAFEAVRGTSAWLGFLLTPTGPSWPAAWLQNTVPVIVMATVLVAAAGLLGVALAKRDRSFLLLGLVLGIALVTFGHTGGAGWPWASALQDLLDGPMAPFRNTHKFELVVRIPVTIGVAFTLERSFELIRTTVRSPRARSRARVAAAFVVAGILVTFAAPGVSANMARPEGYRNIPDHWLEAAAWLDSQPTQGSVLITPSASFADFTWGSTKDEPLQALTRRSFVVRDAVPLGSAGATRFLDSIMDRLATGQAVKRLPTTLSQAGVAYVLVRHDIRIDAQGDQPAVMARALQESGLKLVSSFGPPSGAFGESGSVTVDYRSLIQRPSIEIYAVGRAGTARMVDLEAMPTLTGGPENLAAVTGHLGDVDVLRDVDLPDVAGTGREHERLTIVTDGVQRREVNFGAPAHNTSGLLEAGDRGRSGRAVIDYSVPGEESTLGWKDLASVTASSSASDAYATLRAGPGHGPQQALDGDSRTRWISGRFGRALDEWLQLDFKRPTRVVGTTIELSAASPVAGLPRKVVVETDKGRLETQVFAGPRLRLRTPPGEAAWLRVSLTDIEGAHRNGFSIAELSIPGVTPGPVLDIPGEHEPDLVVLEEGKRGRSECLTLDQQVACSPTLGVVSEDLGWRRSWTSTSDGEYSVGGEVRPVDGEALERLLALPSGWRATASSRLVSAPAGRPDAGIDADPATGWVASPADPRPWYDVSFSRQVQITGLRITKSFALPASTPLTVTIAYDDGTKRTATADEDGRIRLPAKVSRSMRLTFGDVRLMENIDSETGVHSFAPIGFSELEVFGAHGGIPLQPSASTGVPCGFGPELLIDGEPYETRVRGTIRDLLESRNLVWEVCQDGGLISTSKGRVEVQAPATAEFAPSTLTMRSVTANRGQSSASEVTIERRSPSVLVVDAEERKSESVLVLPQNFNSGWTATTTTGRLQAIKVNGWQQGFVVPAGARTAFVVEFAPNRFYQFGLYFGGLLAALVIVAAMRRSDRPSLVQSEARWARSPMVATAVAVVAGGPPGLVAAAVAVVVSRRWTNRLWIVPVALLVAGALVVAQPFPDHTAHVDSVVVQTAVWLSVLTVLWWDEPGRRWSLTRRMIGRSTNR